MDREEVLKLVQEAREKGQRPNLSGADLSWAGLSRANLPGADLSWADLSRADLSGANLSRADLSGANLSGANLSGANLSGANLSWANLSWANLSGANLSRANLSGANLSGAYLSDVKVSTETVGWWSVLPPGELSVWKKCRGGTLVRLRVPADAKRSNATSRKCRVEFAVVEEITGGLTEAESLHSPGFFYRVGETVRPREWNPDRWVECGGGIHCFLTREEAEAFVY